MISVYLLLDLSLRSRFSRFALRSLAQHLIHAAKSCVLTIITNYKIINPTSV